jgi:NAD(P)-dependent dehydrogenase (short-subunit alcohol dehydrogenase family)
MKKLVLVGASGTIGTKIRETFANEDYEIIPVTKSRGTYLMDMEDEKSVKALYEKIGKFDAVVSAAGDVALAPLEQIKPEHWEKSIKSKLMGQIHLVQQALPYINDHGSFTLVSGIASEYPIQSGVTATVVNRAIEAFVFAAATELPRGIRINVVSPNMLTESENVFKPFFPGMKSVPGIDVANAFKKSVMGVQTGQVYRVF